MRTENLLRLIWQGDVRAAADAKAHGFARAFQDIVQARMLVLSCGGGVTRPVVMAEDVELMPALPLGDVLAEELGLDVPYGTLVVMLPETGPCTDRTHGASRALGLATADALLYGILHGALPMERQTDAIYVAAHSALRMAGAPAQHRRGVDQRAFGLGLAAGLAQFWHAGPLSLTDESLLFARSDFLWSSELTAHLQRLDPAFTAPDPTHVPRDLLNVSTGPTGVSLWIARLEDAIREHLGAPAHHMARSQGITSRFNLQ